MMFYTGWSTYIREVNLTERLTFNVKQQPITTIGCAYLNFTLKVADWSELSAQADDVMSLVNVGIL